MKLRQAWFTSRSRGRHRLATGRRSSNRGKLGRSKQRPYRDPAIGWPKGSTVDGGGLPVIETGRCGEFPCGNLQR
jgi:hypothetical protein